MLSRRSKVPFIETILGVNTCLGERLKWSAMVLEWLNAPYRNMLERQVS